MMQNEMTAVGNLVENYSVGTCKYYVHKIHNETLAGRLHRYI